MVERKPFTEVLFHEGTISTLYGLPESGKTNLMVFLSEMAANHDINVWSVIHFFNYEKIDLAMREGLLPPFVKYETIPPNVHTVKKVSDLLLGVLCNKKNATILDEAGVFASTRAPMSKKLRYILNLSYIIRHLRSSFVYVTQTEKSIPPEMRESLVRYEMNIKKANNGTRVLTIKKRRETTNRFGEEDIHFLPIDIISRIPLTRLPWDGHYIPKFQFDINLDEAWDRLGEYDSLEVRDVGAGIIKEMLEEKKEESKTREEKAEEIRDNALRYADELISGGATDRKYIVQKISEKFKRSKTWAYRILTGYDI